MTLRDRVARLNELQLKHYVNPLNKDEQNEWTSHTLAIRMEGERLRKRKEWKVVDGRTIRCAIWYIARAKRNLQCDFIVTNTRPNHKTLKGDCTTRAMAFALNGILSYDEIEKEQYRYANYRNTNEERDGHNRLHRNTTGVWDKLMTDLGYTWIIISKRTIKSTANIALMLKNKIESPILAMSAHHVSIIDENSCLRDTWDSRGVRIIGLLVKEEEANTISNALSNNGVKVVSISKTWSKDY